MRIGIDARMIGKTGIGRYLQNLLIQLAKLDAHNEYILFGKRDKIRERLGDADKRFRCREVGASIYSISEQLLMPLKTSLSGLDILHVPHYNIPVFSWGKLIVTVHDLNHLFIKDELASKTAYLYARLMLSLAVRKALKVIAVSEGTKSDIIRHLKADRDKIVVTHEGVDSSYHPITDCAGLKKVKAKYGISKEYILRVGMIRPYKNIHGLIKAYSKLKNKESYQLVVVGSKDGRYYPEISALVRDLKLEEYVIFTGYVRDLELPYLYGGASLLATVSFNEGFGLPVLEAFGCGIPVLASNIPSLKEVAGDAAVYVNPHDVNEMTLAMERILEDESLRGDLSGRGLKRVKSFSWERMARQTLSVYEDVAS